MANEQDQTTGTRSTERPQTFSRLAPRLSLGICATMLVAMVLLGRYQAEQLVQAALQSFALEQLEALRQRQSLENAVGLILSFMVLLLLALGIRRSNLALRDAQAELKESAAEHERLLDMLPQLVWVCDAGSQVDYVNRRWTEYTGEPRETMLGVGWMRFMHPDESAEVLQNWRAAVASGADSMPSFRLRGKDGSYRWFAIRFGVSRNEQGHPVRWCGSTLDIEEVKQAQAQLQQREQFYRTTLQSLHEGVVTFDVNGLATGCNPAAERMLGLDRQTLLQTPAGHWGIRLHDENGRPVPMDRTPVALVRATARACRDVRLAASREGGEPRWLDFSAEPVQGGPDGAMSAIVASFRDVTERKRVQTELAMYRDHLEQMVNERTRELTDALEARTQADQRMQALNEQVNDGANFVRLVANSVPGRLIYWDRHLICRFVNRTQTEWFGDDPQQVIGRGLREIRGEASYQKVRERVQAALRGEEQDFEQVEYSVRGVRAETRVQYIPDRRDGEVKGFVVLATNITRHKQAEQLLRLRNDQLTEARDRADAANRAKSIFVANMSHEIRTPMNAIIGFTHMLRREIQEPTQRQRLVKIGNAANHLLQVINDILDLSRIEADKLTLETVDFSLDAMLARAASMVIESVRENKLELVMHVEPVPDRLHGDPTRLMQALLNLLSNAVKFTEKGAVSLHVELLAQDQDALTLRFEVRDTGIGIAPGTLAQLFQPFAQADSSSTRQHGGTGLGLAITRRIAESMGGEAGGDSRPGEGSRFWFTARLRIGLNEQTRPVPVLRGTRALVVDDLPQAREALAEILIGLGLRVDSVDSGTLALEQVARAHAQEDPYRVVLLDWAMPGLDGLETGTRLADAVAPPQAMVLLSERDHACVHQLARDAGFGAVLLKPLTASMVLDCLMRLLKNAGRPGLPSEPNSLFDPALPQDRQGARVLLAEDNPVNQEVAVQLLEAAGLVVDVADDGQLAVQMAGRQTYDLVLMDMQMPRMDGLQATRLLRQDPAFVNLPIVAMTANAFKEDRQACLDAGMNDHLAKPVDPRVLHATLLRWLPGERRPPRPAGAPAAGARPLSVSAATTNLPAGEPAPTEPARPAARPARTPAQQLQAMDQLVDLPKAYEYAAGQAGILLRVMQQFVAHYRDAGAGLVEQIRAGDTETPARTLHSLHGVSGMIGASRLREMTTELERALAQGLPPSELLPQAVQLRAELDTLAAAIGERLD